MFHTGKTHSCFVDAYLATPPLSPLASPAECSYIGSPSTAEAEEPCPAKPRSEHQKEVIHIRASFCCCWGVLSVQGFQWEEEPSSS